jgi:hypothetical protein
MIEDTISLLILDLNNFNEVNISNVRLCSRSLSYIQLDIASKNIINMYNTILYIMLKKFISLNLLFNLQNIFLDITYINNINVTKVNTNIVKIKEVNINNLKIKIIDIPKFIKKRGIMYLVNTPRFTKKREIR